MGKYVNDSIVNLGNYGDAIEYATAVREIANLLGVGKRNDGKFYLSDICKVGSINPLARFKPIRSEKNANILEEDRKTVNYGFGTTPLIEPYSSGIPHGVYEYKKPRGSEASPIEWYRLRDFHRYNHIAVSPLQVFFPESIVKEDANIIYCLANSEGLSGWDNDTCLNLHDMVDDTTKDLNVGLLVHRGNNLWLMPSDIKVRNLGPSVFPVFQFARIESALEYVSSDNVFQYVLGDLDNAEGSSYTIAFVATSLGYQSDKKPISNEDGIPTMRSLELSYDSDRKTMAVVSKEIIDGISGYMNVPTWNYTVADDPNGMSGFKVIKPDGNQKLTVRITTPQSWNRTSVYVNVRMSNQYGYIYLNGQMLDAVVNVGKDVTIGAGQTIDVDILPYWSYPYQYWFQFYQSAGAGRVEFTITAWRNSNMSGESIELQKVYVDFPNK